MKNYIVIIFTLVFLSACGTSTTSSSHQSNNPTTNNNGQSGGSYVVEIMHGLSIEICTGEQSPYTGIDHISATVESNDISCEDFDVPRNDCVELVMQEAPEPKYNYACVLIIE